MCFQCKDFSLIQTMWKNKQANNSSDIDTQLNLYFVNLLSENKEIKFRQ